MLTLISHEFWNTAVTGDNPLKTEVEWLKACVYDGKKAALNNKFQNCQPLYSIYPGEIKTKTIKRT